MRALVIGGTGLISTAVVNRLLAHGHEVCIFTRGQRPDGFGDRVRRLKGDRDGAEALKGGFASVRPDAVIDMVAMRPEQAQVCIDALQGSGTHYLFISTVCVYGGPLSPVPAREDHPRAYVGDYGDRKTRIEELLEGAWASGDLRSTTFRPSYTYGPGGLFDSIWGRDPFLVDRIRKRRPLIVPGDGLNLWHPGFVEDVGEAVALSVGRESTFGKAYNANGPRVMTHDEYFKSMAEGLGVPGVELVHVPAEWLVAALPAENTRFLRDIFRHHVAFDTTALRRDVPEWSPKVDHAEGVARTVAWLDREGKNRDCAERGLDDQVLQAFHRAGAQFSSELKG
ncbi:MAG: NAD-dependent epimerase/dehydratase family protein [Candidatus Latescibacteria bacterium]|nr:NAD-dependent epimerase/dehydratase family protein [Candidatus Latescibacterota bacterium]